MTTNEEKPNEDNWDDVDVDEGWEEEETKQPETAEPVVEIDPEDPVAFPEQFYTTQVGYEHEGQKVPAGTTIPVKCSNCAVWKAPLPARGDKPLCRPGRTAVVQVGDETKEWRMTEERYSCQKHFVPKDMEELLGHMRDDIEYVKLLRWAWPTIQKFVGLQERIQTYCEKNDRPLDPMINGVMDFVLLFSSEEQITFTKPFVKSIIEGLAATKPKKQARKRAAFQQGDEVTWEATPGGPRVQGFIRTLGRGRDALITIIVSGLHVQTLKPDATDPTIQWQRPLAEWRQLKPELELATPIITGEDG